MGEWIYYVPLVLFFSLAVAWRTWAYGWISTAKTLVLVAVCILAGLVVQRLVFTG
jgi:hypothetical protein